MQRETVEATGTPAAAAGECLLKVIQPCGCVTLVTLLLRLLCLDAAAALCRGGQHDSEPGAVPTSACSSCRHTTLLPRSSSSCMVRGIVAQGAGALPPAPAPVSHTHPGYQMLEVGRALPR